MTHEFRFKCSCGKVNRFTVQDGPARSMKVRCGECKQVSRLDIPARDSKKAAAKLLRDILGPSWLSP